MAVGVRSRDVAVHLHGLERTLAREGYEDAERSRAGKRIGWTRACQPNVPRRAIARRCGDAWGPTGPRRLIRESTRVMHMFKLI
jgi:hypothetical protein